MRLSRLNNRQLRSLIRNADVMFANGKTNFDNSELIKKARALNHLLYELAFIKEKCGDLTDPLYSLKPSNMKDLKKYIPRVQQYGIKVPSSLLNSINKLPECRKIVNDILKEMESFAATLKPLLRDKQLMKAAKQDSHDLDFQILRILR